MTDFDKTIEKIIHILDEAKAQDVVLMPVDKLSSEFDNMIICTAISQRHVNSLVDYAAQGLKDADIDVYTPRRSQDEWLIVDAGPLLIHVMTEKARDFYRLEDLWGYHKPKSSDESCA
jgi:ribosome-associated protein